jgi:hypothetical protein
MSRFDTPGARARGDAGVTIWHIDRRDKSPTRGMSNMVSGALGVLAQSPS